MPTQTPVLKYSTRVFLIAKPRNSPTKEHYTAIKKKKELLMHVTPRMHLNCANERNQMQKATYYMISCQWISGNGTTVGTEMYLWLPGYRSGGRSLMANAPREHFWTLSPFLRFYCGSIYTTVYICQTSTNGNTFKYWLLLYINYTTILFLKEKEILSI